MSDVDVTTIATRPISNRRIVARALGGILRPYDADGVEPRLVADFANNFYFANNYQVPLSTAFTHARSSSATMVDSTGTLITVGSNVPRIGHHVYNGSAWVNEGYLHESESRTNLLLNSATLATQNVTVTAIAHTLSFYGTGTVTLSGAHSATLVGTGAYPSRVALTFTPTAGTLTVTVSGTVEYANLEIGAGGLGASFPTSYIPTTTATVTRAADVASISGGNFSSWCRQDEGTVFVDVFNREIYSGTNSFPYVAQFDDGTNTERISLDHSVLAGGYRTQYVVRDGDINQASITAQSGLATGAAKWSAAYGLSSFASASNGAAPSEVGGGTVPTVNRLQIGNGFGTQYTGTIKRLTFWPQRLPNKVLQTITQ